jgi:hypothetical protein
LDDSDTEDVLFDDDAEQIIILLAVKERERIGGGTADEHRRSAIFACSATARSARTCSCTIISRIDLSASSIS